MLSLRDGERLVKLARRAVERVFEKGKLVIEKANERLKEKQGVFVTIETFPKKELRGCIGFPYPAFPLYEGVQRAAYSAAFEDARFDPLKRKELDKVIFEVSVLSKPELIKVKHPKEYLKKIKKGKDGLILVHKIFSGLFLPQVWEKIGSVEEFLENLCWKAGLTSDYWLHKDTKIYRFRVKVFVEERPRGKVAEKAI